MMIAAAGPAKPFPWMWIAIAVGCAVIAAVLAWILSANHQKKVFEETVGTAEVKSREIIDEAIKTAAEKKREALLEAKEENLAARNDLERETKERRAELQRTERRLQNKEESLDKKIESLERKEQSVQARDEQLKRKDQKVQEIIDQQQSMLEQISGFSKEEAKEYLIRSVEEDARHDIAKKLKEIDAQAKEDATRKAKEYIVTAIQKCAADHVAEVSISVVPLPNDEMKGRIIGREGRNIRALEQATGVDLIVDDTPEAVVLSGFDGRIHPARIEEVVAKSRKEVEEFIKEQGEAAVLEVGVHGIHPELVKLLGRMHFRTSYGQNALKHSIEVAHLSGLLAGELGLDVRLAKRAGLLHDIGKSLDHDMEGSHVQIGADLCRKYRENAVVINSVESHHGDVEATSLIACIVQAADAISAARPGARRETLEAYTNRLSQLEEITNGFKGVDKSFAIQAGREVRVMVIPEQINDDAMTILAHDIAKRIEDEMEYPGQIKVSVIRESRSVDYAK